MCPKFTNINKNKVFHLPSGIEKAALLYEQADRCFFGATISSTLSSPSERETISARIQAEVPDMIFQWGR